jgi:hypothetical protein
LPNARNARRSRIPHQMRRFQLVELEDLDWWPVVIRDLATDYLGFMESRFQLHRTIVPLLAAALRRANTNRIVDLCSGSGGPLESLVVELRWLDIQVMATLTDRFPNVRAMVEVSSRSKGAITFERDPIDARRVPDRLDGFRTLFNSFHHFKPEDAVAVLASAVRNRQPIGIFEIPTRALWAVAAFLLTPLFVWLATPFIRPFSWRRLLWTYLVPLVPVMCLWDGVVSQLRAYHAEELYALTEQFRTDYSWEYGRTALAKTPGSLTYLIGIPAIK